MLARDKAVGALVRARIDPGHPIAARFLNLYEGELNRRGITAVRQDSTLNPNDESQPPQGAGIEAEQMTVSGEGVDTLTCVSSQGLVTVAKPHHLRGAIGTRSINGEPQIILPQYTAGPFVVAVITALKVGTVGTGISGVEWIEMVPHRMWAENV